VIQTLELWPTYLVRVKELADADPFHNVPEPFTGLDRYSYKPIDRTKDVNGQIARGIAANPAMIDLPMMTDEHRAAWKEANAKFERSRAFARSNVASTDAMAEGARYVEYVERQAYGLLARGVPIADVASQTGMSVADVCSFKQEFGL
jgi:hypothetical protein